MTNSIFHKLVPKEPKFFPILKEISSVVLSTSELMLEFIQKGNKDNALEYYTKIKSQERVGDNLTNKVFSELNTTFITPFDREDIHQLANKLDDVTDRITSSAKKIQMYNPKRLPESAVYMAQELNHACICIVKAVEELNVLKKDSKQIKEYCLELHVIENRADDVYEQFLIDLFENEKDVLEVIKLKEIVSELEKAVDIAEQVGKLIQTIIVKYA